jgi:hypothetical protein
MGYLLAANIHTYSVHVYPFFYGCEVQIATDASQVGQLLLAKLLAEIRWTNYGKQVTI